MRHRVLWLLVLAGALAAPVAIRAQATPDVPLEDVGAYADLDALISAGLVRRVMVGDRPYSEQRFREMVQEARHRGAARALPAALVAAQDRLERRFREKIAAVTRVGPNRLDVSMARTTSRPMRGMSGATNWLDADLDPLVQRNRGVILDNGLGVAVDARIATASRFLATDLSGRVSLAAGDNFKALVQVPRAYARFIVAPAQFDVGRHELQLGYGIDGGTLVSGNARALDGARLQLKRPYGASEGWRSLFGMWQVSQGIYTLGNNRDNPGSILSIGRLSGKLGPWIEGGMTYLNVQFGRGAPGNDLGGFFNTIFLRGDRWWDYSNGADKVAGADLRIAIPSSRLALTADFFSTDTRVRFQDSAHGYWEDAVWNVGLEQRAVGPDQRWDWRFEWRHAGPDTHGHGQWTSGIALDRRVIGDPLGPNAEGVGLQFAQQRASGRWSAKLAAENYFSSDYAMIFIEPPRPPKWSYWKKLAEGVTEHRSRLELAWDASDATSTRIPRLRMGWERVNRFRFTHGTVDNFVLGASWRWR